MSELPKIANDDGKGNSNYIPIHLHRGFSTARPPHVSLEMGKIQIICPYCGTIYKLVDAVDYLDDLKE